jgi:hypothetical protein
MANMAADRIMAVADVWYNEKERESAVRLLLNKLQYFSMVVMSSVKMSYQ